MNELKATESKIEMQIVVRDKDGNVKYQGPLNMQVVSEERKEDGNDPSDRR